MKLPLVLLLTILLFIFSSTSVSAHPGNTAADGCHYCRTNCDSWGVPWNERHCHGGASNTNTAPQVVSSPVVQPTSAPTIKPTVRPMVKPIVKPTVTPTSTPTSTPVASLSPQPSPTNRPSPTVKAKAKRPFGFWGWLMRLFGR